MMILFIVGKRQTYLDLCEKGTAPLKLITG